MIGTAANPLYLLGAGEEWMLVEGGIAPNAGLVLSQLRAILPDLSVLRHWFITHAHYDHCGAVEYLYPHFPGVRLYASASAIESFRNPKYVQKVRALNGLPDGGAVRANDDQVPCLTRLPFTAVGDGDRITAGGQEWQVIATPGHSRCSLSLYNPARKILFVSDALGEIITPEHWVPLAFDSMQAFTGSVRRLQECAVAYVALGHHGVLAGSAARLAARSCLDSCGRLIALVRETVRKEGIARAQAQVVKTFRSSQNSFVPQDVYEKSMAQLVKVLVQENPVPPVAGPVN